MVRARLWPCPRLLSSEWPLPRSSYQTPYMLLGIAVVNEDHQHAYREKHAGDGRGKPPVADFRHLLIDVQRGDENAPAPHQDRHRVRANRDGEDEERTRENAWHRHRQRN